MKIIDVLDILNIPIAPPNHEHRTIGWETTDCPFCDSPNHFRLGIPLNSKTYARCWVCGWKSLTIALSLLADKPYQEIQKLLETIEVTILPEEFIHKKRLLLPEGIGQLKQIHRDYLKSRGFIPDEIIDKWRVEAIGESHKYKWRLFIPIIHKGETISWTTRSLNNQGKRYLNAPKHCEALSMKSILYGEDFAKHCISVHEGCTEVWKIGFGAVATMGVGYSQNQLIRVSRYPRRIIAFNNEPDAQKRAQKLCNDLSLFPGETLNVCPSTKDFCTAPKKEVNQLKRMLV